MLFTKITYTTQLICITRCCGTQANFSQTLSHICPGFHAITRFTKVKNNSTWSTKLTTILICTKIAKTIAKCIGMRHERSKGPDKMTKTTIFDTKKQNKTDKQKHTKKSCLHIYYETGTHVYIYIYYRHYAVHTEITPLGYQPWVQMPGETSHHHRPSRWMKNPYHCLASYSVITSLYHRKLEITIKLIVFQSQ